MDLGGKELVRFGMIRYDGVYFRKVHTYNVEKFEEYISKLKQKDEIMHCFKFRKSEDDDFDGFL